MRASNAIIICNDFLILLNFKFVNHFGTYDIGVIDDKGLVSSAVLLEEFHHQLFVVGDSEFIHRKDCPLGTHALNLGNFVVSSHGIDDLLLNGCSFGDFLVNYFESNKIDRKRHIGTVFNLYVEVKKAVIDINSHESLLDAKTLATDVFNLALVAQVYRFHYQLNHFGGLVRFQMKSSGSIERQKGEDHSHTNQQY